MRFLSVLCASLLLAACATAAPPPSTTPRQPAPSSTPTRGYELLSAAGRNDAPTQAEIERVFGAPDIVRRDGAGAALTYRMDHCALLLVFAADARNAMRLAEAHPGPRRGGEATPSLEQCAAEASARG